MKFILLLFLFMLINAQDVTKLTNKQRKYVLKEANTRRSIVAKGSDYYDYLGHKTIDVPPASNMYKLTYSIKLEKKAFKKAISCDTNLSLGYTFDISNYYGHQATQKRIASRMFAWDSSFQQYRTTFHEVNTRPVPFTKQPLIWTEGSKDALLNYPYVVAIYHTYGSEFGQLVFAKTSQIGCAVHTCKNFTGQWVERMKANNKTIASNNEFVVCAYSKKIAYGQKVYKKGYKLKCPKGSRPSKSFKKLCTIKGVKEIHK